MQIEHLTIENHRNIPDMAIDVAGHVVLIGPNASGKSSVLRLLDATLGWSRARLQRELTLSAIRDDSQRMACSIRLANFTDDELAEFADELSVGQTEAESTLTVQLVLMRSPTDPDDIEVSREFVQAGVMPIPVAKRHLEGFGWRLIEAGRSPERDLSPSGSGVLGQIVKDIDLGDGEKAVSDAIVTLETVLGSIDTVKALRTDVAAALTRVYPDDVSPADIDIRMSSDRSPLRSANIFIREAGAEDTRLLAEQSDGMRSLTIMSLRLLGHGRERMTAIDEPECHLDIRSQARIGRLFAADGGQRVIATHSPTVMRQFAPVNAVVLAHDGVRQLASERFAKHPKFHSRWWVEDMIEPLTSKSLILVEGRSDEIVVRQVARLLGKDFDSLAVSVIALGGADEFAGAMRLYGSSGFDIRVSSLVDKKERLILSKALGVADEDLSEHNVVVCDQDLEAECVRALGAGRVIEMMAKARLTKNSSQVDDDAVSEWCRKKKVEAAQAIADALTEKEAGSIAPIADLIGRATDL